MATLRELLIQDLLSDRGEHRSTLLWLDPARDWKRLWPPVSVTLEGKRVRVLDSDRDDGSQLGLKLALLAPRGDDEVVVVYLPGFDTSDLEPRPDGTAPELWSVFEYRFKGAVWGVSDSDGEGLPQPRRLIDWLEANGVAFVDQATRAHVTEGGPDSMLALYALDRIDAELSAWPFPVRESDVIGELGGDPRDSLRDLIASPKNTVRGWRDSALTLEGIAQRFGLQTRRSEDPEEIADSFLVQLALTEAWDAFGRPADFPFTTRLPATDAQRDRAIRFLREDVLKGRELGTRYRERMLRLEHDYDLTSWSKGRTGEPRGLPVLARNRFREFLSRFDELARTDWKAAAQLLLEERESFAGAAETPWEGPEGETQWSVLRDAARLTELAREASERSQRLDSDQLLEAYVEDWFEIDRLHLAVRAACVRATGLERVRRVSDLVYFDYAETVNSRLSEILDRGWPPFASGVGELPETLWAPGHGRRAVLIVDALRWDLARDLADKLQARVVPVVSTLPSTTPFGMSVLLPLSTELPETDFQKAVTIRIPGGPDLAKRDGRKAYLETELKARGSKCSFLNLDDLLQGAPVPDVPRVVVFDNTIDEQGHKGTEEFPVLTEQLVGKLRRAVEKLHESGIDEVHVVTDHGFLLLPKDMVDGLGRPTVNVNQVLRREHRWAALKPGTPVSGLLQLPLPLGKQEIELGFPRGVRTLMAPKEDFIHGGISLQECVIPHLISQVAMGPVRTEVEVGVATHEITGGTIAATIRPFSGGGTLGDSIPIEVRLWIEAGGTPVTDVLAQEVRVDTGDVKLPLYLKEGAGLSAGEDLTLRVVDGETERELASISLRMKVDWE